MKARKYSEVMANHTSANYRTDRFRGSENRVCPRIQKCLQECAKRLDTEMPTSMRETTPCRSGACVEQRAIRGVCRSPAPHMTMMFWHRSLLIYAATPFKSKLGRSRGRRMVVLGVKPRSSNNCRSRAVSVSSPSVSVSSPSVSVSLLSALCSTSSISASTASTTSLSKTAF